MKPLGMLTVVVLLLAMRLLTSAEAAERVPWTTSRVTGTPDPPLRMTTERIFPSLSFHQPVDMASLIGTDWMYVMELTGKVFAFEASQTDPQARLVFDARELFPQHNHSYGIAFHPQFDANRFIYVSWTLPGQVVEDGTTVSRFGMSTDNPPRVLPETRTDIIQWHGGGHNGACLKFGPDGCLYISAGDGVGPFPPDSANTGQDLSDLRSTIFRIDVDHPTEGRQYGIPADNPFVDLADARPEVWAYGFRNPWKMCFNPINGDLFAGDVGWELWELVFRVEKGGNYGWSVMEGRQPIRSDVERGPTPILPPLIDHPHIEAKSITGGYVYRGERLPELQGAYLYGDYVTGKIWGLRNDGNQVTWQEELADTPLAIITFGESRQGEQFVVDYGGGIYRLIPNPRFGHSTDFPQTLSATGLFEDIAEQRPSAGVVTYSLIAEPWMEGATAQRFVALPQRTSIKDASNREHWEYPPGSVFAKTISIPAVDGVSQSRKLETQILHFDGEQWRPYTYLWNDQQTEAFLAPAEGSQTSVTLAGEDWTWRFHSRAECNTCHTARGGFTLGFFPQNLAVETPSAADQLTDLVEMAIFADTPAERDLQPPIVDPDEPTADLQSRARAYLMMNCAHCHRRGGGGTAAIEFPLENNLKKTNAIDTVPTQGMFNIPQARIIAPGDPYRSVLLYRMATVGRGHMPHLGTRRVDEEGLALVHEWIAELPGSTSDSTATEFTIQQRETESAAINKLLDVSPDDETPQRTDVSVARLLDSVPGGLQLAWRIGVGRAPADLRQQIIATGSAHKDPIIRGLFERFLPESQRSERLGTLVDASQILSRTGDRDRGRELYRTAAGVQCRNCHQVGEFGKSVGPKLDDVGKRLTREQILESILDPSRRIDTKWVGHTVVTDDGLVVTGLLENRSDDHILLRDNQGKEHRIATAEIEEMVALQKSLMPELLVQDLTAAQLTDLLEYLSSLK